jgi:hypothetical protein
MGPGTKSCDWKCGLVVRLVRGAGLQKQLIGNKEAVLKKTWVAYLTIASTVLLTPVAACSSPSSPSTAGSFLVFTVQPYGAVAGVAFAVQPIVAIEDRSGVVDSSAPVTIYINPVTGPSGAVLVGNTSGTVTVNCVNGVASFTGLAIVPAGVGYTMTAISPGLTSATSEPFNVVPVPVTTTTTVRPPTVTSTSTTSRTMTPTSTTATTTTRTSISTSTSTSTSSKSTDTSTPPPTTVPTTTSNSSPTSTATTVGYSATIQPLLATYCGPSCHGASGRGGVNLSTYAGTLATVVPGNAAGSRLYRSLTGTSGVSKMPPGSSLSAGQMRAFADWINQGAPNN